MAMQQTDESLPEKRRLPFPPLLQLMFWGIAGSALVQLAPAAEFPPDIWSWQWLAAGTAVAGLIVLALSVRLFHTAGTTVNPVEPSRADKLVTTGIFRFTRNPMYLGMLFVLIGGMFAWQNWAAMIGPLGFIVSITCLQIIPEERVLLIKFGSAFDTYRRGTRRWI